MTEPTEDQIGDWYYDCPNSTLYHTVDWLARQAFAAGAASRAAEIADAQAQAKTLATANADNARELQERLESLEAQLADALEPGGWLYPEGHANYYMRTRVAGTLSIGHAVYDASITQEPVNNAAEDAARYRWLADYFIGDSNEYDDAIVAAKTRQELNGVIDDARNQGETK